jgi:transposase
MPDPHPWTTRALAKSLRASRLSYAAIADAVGVAKATVIRWLESPRAGRVRRRCQRRHQAAHLEQHAAEQARYRLRKKLEDASVW